MGGSGGKAPPAYVHVKSIASPPNFFSGFPPMTYAKDSVPQPNKNINKYKLIFTVSKI